MSYSQTLSEICDCTYKMLEMAQKNQWSELQEAENNRSDLLKKLQMQNSSDGPADLIEQKLKEILELNQLITVLSIQQKDSCLSEFYQLKASKKATSEYTRY